jgi:hypothetical protein
MLNFDNYAITFGRAVDVFRRGRDAVPEQKVALRALTALSRLAGVVLDVGAGELRVGGTVVPPALPGISVLLAQLEGHDVAEIRIRQAASPASLLHLLRGLAEPLGAGRPVVDLAARLRTAGVDDVEVRLLRSAEPVPQPPLPPPPPAPAFGTSEATTEQIAVEAAVRNARRLSRPEVAVAAVVLDPEGPEVPGHLETAATRIREELDHGRASGAVRALAQLIQLEGNAGAGEVQQALSDAIEPLLTDEAFRGAMECAGAEGTREAALRVLRRGGPAATAMLRARLMTETDEVAARQVLRLLREQPEGLRSLILLLQHGDREIIRRAAAVLGMLGVREAVPALTRVARHDDLTVRAAAIAALARLATPQAVELLGELLDEAGLDGMGVVVDALGGAALGPLVPRLENLGRRVHDARALATLAHALGRIGTRQAVGVLADWAAPSGWRFWRRRGAVRLAAVDGLRIAAAPEAVRILEGLSRDADPAVRRAALEAVEDLSIAAPARGP